MPPRRRAFAPGMAAGRREENYFSAPQGQNPPQNRQNPRNRNENPHRQSRPAASRIAGASNRSRQPTGDSRPPSLGEKSRKGFPLPGFRRQRRKESESFFPATRAAGKILLTERRVGAALAGPAPKRSAIATGGTPGPARGNGSASSPKHLTERRVAARPRPSGVTGHRLSALGALRRGLLAGENRLGDFSQRRACRRRAARPSGA